MSYIIKLSNIENKIIEIRKQKVILDVDVAEIYGIETKRVNEAVRNNPEKFPEGYVLELSKAEFSDLRSKISTAKFSKTRSLPKAFTERGLYMLATILKSEKATEATIGIIETFTKLREFSRTVSELTENKEDKVQKSLMKQSADILTELLGNDKDISETETSIELNFALLKIKHTVKRKNSDTNEVHEEEPVYITIKKEGLTE